MNRIVNLLVISFIASLTLNAQNDTALINKLNNEGYRLAFKNVSKAQEKVSKALALSEQEGYSLGEAKSFYYLAIISLYKGNYDSSLYYTSNAYKLFSKLKSTNDIGLSLNLKGTVYQKKGEYKIAIKYHRKALTYFDKDKYKGSANTEIGSCYYGQRNFDSSEYYYLKAITYMQKSNDEKSMVFCHRNLGLVAQKRGDYQLAMEYYYQALKKAEQLNDKLSTALTQNSIAGIFYKLKDYKQAIGYYEKAIKQFEELGHKRSAANSYLDIGTAYNATNRAKQALEYNFIAIKLYKEIGAKRSLHLTYNNIGVIYKKNKEYTKADSFYRVALEMAENLDFTEGIVRANNNLGDLYLSQKLEQNALNIFSENLLTIESSNNTDPASKVQCLKGLAASQQKTGDFEAAYLTQLKLDSLQESLFSLDKVSKINELTTKYEAEKNELRVEQEKLKVSLLKKDRKLLFAAILVLSLLAIGVIIFIRYRNKRKAVMQKLKLSKLTGELKKKEKELVTAALNIANKHELLEDIKNKVSDIRNGDVNIKGKTNTIITSIERSISDEKEWESFLKLFENLHPHFIKTLTQNYLSLNQSEIRLCALYKLNLSNHEVKNILNITTTSLTTARYRLRKKLNIDSKTELSVFLTQISGKD